MGEVPQGTPFQVFPTRGDLILVPTVLHMPNSLDSAAFERIRHMRQLGPDSGAGFRGKVLKSFKLFPLRSTAEVCVCIHLES